MPDSPLRRATLEMEAYVAADGWDQAPRLFALVPTADLVSKQPELADHVRLGRVRHVDDRQHMIAEIGEVDREIGVAAADVPDPVWSHAVSRHEAAFAGCLRARQIVHTQPSRVGRLLARACIYGRAGRRGA